ncbi:MAG: hypothetical protein VKP62_15405 [Candidatus Sericytochromatia bacterium]|nr:hypothetical protein [Candidatus Sericytochromatia bacterium]
MTHLIRRAAWIVVTGALLASSGCVPFGSSARTMRPEITSMMKFAAYPGATTLSTEPFGANDPLGLPSSGAMRTLQTKDTPSRVFAHYQKLHARYEKEGWTLESGTWADEGGDQIPENYERAIRITLALKQKMRIEINVAPEFEVNDSVSASPAPSPTPSAPSADVPTPSPSPSSSPGVKKTWKVTQSFWVY